MLVLVVGANGQLGFRCCEELVRRGHQVRGSVRSPERAGGLASVGVDVVTAEPASATGLGAALSGVDAVLLTANSAAPRAGDDLTATQAGFERLVTDAERAGVRRYCLVSSAHSRVEMHVPLEAGKRKLERRVTTSSMEHVILRLPPLMEVWLALVGSSLPLRGEAHATVGRPSPFLRSFRKMSGSLVEDRGLMLVPGSVRVRNAFLAQTDAARACAEVLERAETARRDIEVGGPEVLTWGNVAAIYSDVLGRQVRIMSTPASVYAAAAALLKPVAPIPSATMALNRLAAVTETPWAPGGGGLVDPASMTTVRAFLESKAALPDALPRVA